MAVDIVKNDLSASTHGRGILVAATATLGTTIHTSRAVSSAGQFDEVWIWAVNTSASSVKLTIEYGGATSPNDHIEFTLLAENGLYLMIPGLLMRNSQVITAFAGTANVIVLHGFVNELG